MKTFEYSGFAAEGGRRVRGWIEADDLKSARERLAARGVLPERVDPADAAPGGRRRSRGLARLSTRAVVFRELASLLGAGLPAPRALDILVESPEWAAARTDLAAVRDRIREGASLSAALEAGGSATSFEIAALRAGERAGALQASLERTADYLEQQTRVRERIISALIYPAVVLTLTVLIAVGMLGFLLPTLVRLWDESGIPLPAFTRAVMAAGRAMRWMLPVVGGLVALTAVALRRATAHSARWVERADRFRYRLPVVGQLYRTLVGFRFARSLAMLLRGGAPMVEALPLAGRATGSPWTAQGVERATEEVRHGRSPADALRAVEPLRDAIPSWVRAGESGGNLPDLLEVAADRQQAAWERRLGRVIALLEPALVLLLGALVLVVTLAIVLPILALNRGIG